MRNALLLARREIASFLGSPLGYVVAASALLAEGLWFTFLGLNKGTLLSAQVLGVFFEGACGTTMILAALLSMRLLAGERENGTLVLLNTAPIRESEIVAGKFLAGLAFLAMIAALTVYMPALIYLNGKVSIGHIVVGYVGVVLLASASLAVGLFASALAPNQVVAVIVAGVMLGVLFLIFFVAQNTDPPINTVLFALSIFHVRARSFMTGVLKLENVLYYVGISYFFLFATTKALEARRWR